MEPAERAAVEALLECSTLALSTCSPSGEPHCAPVYFAAGPGLRLYFFSAADSLHALHLQANPQAAGAVYPEASHWQEIRGLQVHGRVEVVQQAAEMQTAWQLYMEKFPFTRDFESQMRGSVLFVLTPDWLRLLDNRRHFGFKQEWRFEIPPHGAEKKDERRDE